MTNVWLQRHASQPVILKKTMPYIKNSKSIRVRLKLSQAKLAAKAGVDRGTVSRCEHGYFIVELSCSKIQDALEEESRKLSISIPAIEVEPGGIAGEMPTKAEKTTKRKKASKN